MRTWLLAGLGLLALLGAKTAVAVDPVIPAWIDINAQIAAPVTGSATPSWTGLDMVTTDSELSAGFDFSSLPRADVVRPCQWECPLS